MIDVCMTDAAFEEWRELVIEKSRRRCHVALSGSRMAYRVIHENTCDLCGEKIDGHRFERKREIAGAMDLQPSTFELCVSEAANHLRPIDLCVPCWRVTWERIDPEGKIRQALSREAREAKGSARGGRV